MEGGGGGGGDGGGAAGAAGEQKEEQVGVDVSKFIDEAIAAGKGWTDEERRAYLASIDDAKHPFFAQSIEDMDPDMVEAFRAIAYEDETPETLARNMKDVGNERFKRTRLNKLYFKTAAEAYTEGIKHSVMAEQTEEMVALRGVLLANRAAASLGRKNYGGCIRDCDASLGITPGNVKCYFRKARALIRLRRFKEALATVDECCGRGSGEGGDPVFPVEEFSALRKQCLDGIEEDRLREEEKARRREEQCSVIAEVYRRCSSRKISLGPSIFEEGHYRWQSQFMPRPVGRKSSALTWPVLLLYPQYGQSDFIQAAAEEDILALHMAEIFPEEGPPMPWDHSFDYRCSNLSVYVKLNGTRPYASEEECVQDFLRVKALRGEEIKHSDLPDLPSEESDDEDDEATEMRKRIEQWRIEEGQRWALVHPGCTILQLLEAEGHVVANGTIVLFLVPSEGPAHTEFCTRAKADGGVSQLQIVPK